jgi:hypothetical protein
LSCPACPVRHGTDKINFSLLNTLEMKKSLLFSGMLFLGAMVSGFTLPSAGSMNAGSPWIGADLANALAVAGPIMRTDPMLRAGTYADPLTQAERKYDDPITQAERKYAVDYFLQTRQRLLDDVKGLSDAQLNFKADPSRWSIAQCTEHIAVAETFVWQWIQMSIHQPATPEKRGDVKSTTEQLMQGMTDRSHKFNAPEPLQPAGKFEGFEPALKAYTLRRDSTIAYFQSTQDDLKDHFITHPVFGTMDLYQGLVLLAAHSARHSAQIEEVKADANFPKQ